MSPFLRLPGLLWEAAWLITDNAVGAARFFHEASLEILELIQGPTDWKGDMP